MLDIVRLSHQIVIVPKSELISVVEAARILGWSRWTVTRALNDPDHPLTGFKLGDGETSAWILDRAAVEKLRDELDARNAS